MHLAAPSTDEHVPLTGHTETLLFRPAEPKGVRASGPRDGRGMPATLGYP